MQFVEEKGLLTFANLFCISVIKDIIQHSDNLLFWMTD